MVSNGVASYILKVSSIPKFLLMLCSVIISCFPFSIQIHRMGHVGSQADLMYPCISRYHFSLKMICRFCISSLQRKAHTHIVKRIITSGSLSQLASATAAKALQLCPTLSDPMDGSPPSSSVHGIFQARVLEWGAIAFSAQLVQTDVKQEIKKSFFMVLQFLSLDKKQKYLFTYMQDFA